MLEDRRQTLRLSAGGVILSEAKNLGTCIIEAKAGKYQSAGRKDRC